MSDETEVSPEVRQKATEMGWVDKPDFKGDPEKWIPADQFVERGEHLLPILHATNKRLKGDVESMKGQVNEVTQALRQAQETIAALETYHDEEVKRKVALARENLKAELATASREGDHVAVADLTSKITELNADEKADQKRREDEEAERKAAASRPKDYTKDPAFIAWRGKNPWYGTDMVRTSIAHTMSWKLRDPNYEGVIPNHIVGEAFLEEVGKAVEREITKLTGGRAPGSGSTKVEGGNTRSNNNNGAGKTFNDMPKEARDACDSFEKQLVGPGKVYKTKEDMRKKYAERHFSE